MDLQVTRLSAGAAGASSLVASLIRLVADGGGFGVRSRLNLLRSNGSRTSSCPPGACCRGAAFALPAFGVGRCGRLPPVVAALGRVRRLGVPGTGRVAGPKETVCRTAIGVVPVRLVRSECVEVVATAVGEEPGEESLPVKAFLAEPPKACRGRLMPDRRVPAIERPVLS
jgi:hypothetical protein